MRRLALAALLACAVVPAQAGAQTPCPGASGPCPYVSQAQIGESAGGVLRFPQSVAVAPDGSIAVADQHSRLLQVFAPDGTFLRTLGKPGRRAGELSSVGAVAYAGDGTLFAADGEGRVDRFAPDGRLVSSFGSRGQAVGQFRFGAGGGNDAGAGGGLAVGGEFLYVVDSGNDRVQRFNLDGSAARELVPPGLLAYPKGVAVRKTRVLVADNQNHRVLAFDTGGRQLATIGKGRGRAPGQLEHPYGVASDAQGRVFVADNLNHRIVRFGPPGAYTYVSRFGAFGTLPGRLAYVRALATDAQGQVLVANTGNDRIDVFSREGRLVRSFGRSGRANGQFNTPGGVAADAQGFRAAVDTVNGRVQILDPAGKVVTVWGTPNPGPTVLLRPVATAFSPEGTLYVLDQRRARVFVFSRQTGLPIRSIGSQGAGPGKLLEPSAIAVSPGGTIYVADTGNDRIARFAPDGSYQGAWTDVGAPRGVAVAPDGQRIYVSNTENRILALDVTGRTLQEFGGTGNTLGKVNSPGQLTVDAGGTVWVADRGNNRVQQFGPDGQRLGMFGTRGTGPGEFTFPAGISVSCGGLLTVSDEGNNRVQQFQLAAPAVTPCAELPPLGTPTAPQVPTLPPPPGPDLTATVLRATKVLSTRTVPVKLRCDTPCKIQLTGAVAERDVPKPRRRGAKARRPVSVRLTPAKVDLGGATTRTVRLRLPAAAARTLGKALGARKGIVLDVAAIATSATGEETSVSARRDASR